MKNLGWVDRQAVARILGNGWQVAPMHLPEQGDLINPQRQYRIALYETDTHFIAESYPSFEFLGIFTEQTLTGFPTTKIAKHREIVTLAEAIEVRVIDSLESVVMPPLLEKYHQHRLYEEKVFANMGRILRASGGNAREVEKSKEHEMQWDSSHLKRWRVYEDNVRIDCFEGIPLEVFIKFMENMAEYKSRK